MQQYNIYVHSEIGLLFVHHPILLLHQKRIEITNQYAVLHSEDKRYR